MSRPGRPAPGGPEERRALLDALRRRIARGEYRVPTEAVADAVLAAWARRGPGGAGSAGGGETAQPG